MTERDINRISERVVSLLLSELAKALTPRVIGAAWADSAKANESLGPTSTMADGMSSDWVEMEAERILRRAAHGKKPSPLNAPLNGKALRQGGR